MQQGCISGENITIGKIMSTFQYIVITGKTYGGLQSLSAAKGLDICMLYLYKL